MVASSTQVPAGCSRASQIASASSESGSPMPMLIWRPMDTRIAAGSAPLESSSYLGASAPVPGEATPSARCHARAGRSPTAGQHPARARDAGLR